MKNEENLSLSLSSLLPKSIENSIGFRDAPKLIMQLEQL